MNNKPIASIIVRTKNEEKWINTILKSIFNQSIKNTEVVIVDNNSTDNTLKIAEKYDCKILKLKNFKPGLAINEGIRNSTGEFLVCISAHCIPTSNFWLKNLLLPFKGDKSIAAVYGRQIPLLYSDPNDKRDLYNLFGTEKKIQTTDSFFHNANSVIRRDIWDKHQFDEEISNIEDRLWAKIILDKGYKICYSPEAMVFHYHGVNHYGNIERATNISKILDELTGNFESYLNPQDSLLCCIIPVKTGNYNDEYYINKINSTINQIITSKNTIQIYLYCDRSSINDFFLFNSNIKVIERKKSSSYLSMFNLLSFVLKWIERDRIVVDNVILTTLDYADERENFLIDNIIDNHFKTGADISVISENETSGILIDELGNITPIENSFEVRSNRNVKVQKVSFGLFTIINSYVLRSDNFFERKWNYIEKQ